jgi:hypothetical protein
VFFSIVYCIKLYNERVKTEEGENKTPGAKKNKRRDSRHKNNPTTNRRPTKMFSLERLLIAFSAFLGDSISKTPKVHVLVCLCAFGLLAVGIVLVEIEHDVFKLWVRFRSRYHLVSNEIFFSSR